MNSNLTKGDSVRPVVALAGLDSRLVYKVAHVEATAFGYALCYLTCPIDGSLVTVENAQLILEKVGATPTMRPNAALPV